MCGILVATHGNLGESLINTAQQIFGTIDNIDFISLDKNEKRSIVITDIKNKIIQLDKESDNNGVLILGDLYGGTPANYTAEAIFSLKQEIEVECLLGVNLPMLLEALTKRNQMKLNDLSKDICKVGQRSIIHLNNI